MKCMAIYIYSVRRCMRNVNFIIYRASFAKRQVRLFVKVKDILRNCWYNKCSNQIGRENIIIRIQAYSFLICLETLNVMPLVALQKSTLYMYISIPHIFIWNLQLNEAIIKRRKLSAFHAFFKLLWKVQHVQTISSFDEY